MLTFVVCCVAGTMLGFVGGVMFVLSIHEAHKRQYGTREVKLGSLSGFLKQSSLEVIVETAAQTLRDYDTSAVGLIVAMRREGELVEQGIHNRNGINTFEETERRVRAARGDELQGGIS